MAYQITSISFVADEKTNDALWRKYVDKVYEDMTKVQILEEIEDKESLEIDYLTCEEGDFFLDNADLILSDSRGIYIPQNFCENWSQNNISNEDWQCCLNGPDWDEEIPCTFWQKFCRMLSCYLKTGLVDWNIAEYRTAYNEWYWEAWQFILDNWEAEADGIKYALYQDGDLWMLKEKIEPVNPTE